MTAADTSVTVAVFASWHEHHRAARRAASKGLRLIAHVAVETYSVLTRLPPPRRAPGGLVEEFLRRSFRGPLLGLPPAEHRRLLRALADREITGGAAYDALVAATARHAGATLVTLDRRALPTYEAFDVDVELLG